MKKQDKCRIAHCRAETDIMFADGTGLCEEHWSDKCRDEQKDGLNQVETGLEGQERAGQSPYI